MYNLFQAVERGNNECLICLTLLEEEGLMRQRNQLNTELTQVMCVQSVTHGIHTELTQIMCVQSVFNLFQAVEHGNNECPICLTQNPHK